MDNSLIKIDGDSKALSTLIDAISRGIGTLYRPWGIKREAKAKAAEIQILAEAKVKEQQIFSEAKKQLDIVASDEQLHRTISRIVNQELRRQENIDAIAKIALAELAESRLLAVKEQVETDWLTRYFDIVQDVSDERLRNAWGKILSQEIMSPGSYSLRTLNTVSNLSKKEAELFASLGNLVLSTGSVLFFINKKDSILGSDISFNNISLLMECGLIREEHALHIIIEPKEKPAKSAWIYQDKALLLDFKTDSCRVPIYELTSAGRELYKILTVSFQLDYLKQIVAYFKNIQLGYSKLISFNDDQIEYDDDVVKL